MRLSSMVKVVLTGIVFLGIASAASANNVSVLTDGGSTAQFDLLSDQGLNAWTVDGVNQITRQWFWLRIGSEGGQSAINPPRTIFAGTSDTNFDGNLDTLIVRHTATQVKVEATFTLTGATGEPKSDLAETIKITNLTRSPLDLHFFQFVDLALGGTVDDAAVGVSGGNTAMQADFGYYASETVVTPRPSHYQVGLGPDLYALLTGGAPLTLNDTAGPVGPGDLAWAFQWDTVLGAAGTPTASLIISKDKQIVPEPATMALLIAGGVGAAIRRRRAA